MRKIWVVIRREFMERVKSKWFLVGTVLGPVFMAATLVLPIMLASRGARERHIAVVDLTSGGFGRRVTTELDASDLFRADWLVTSRDRAAAMTDSLEAEVSAKALDGLLILEDSVAVSGRTQYRGSNVSSPRDMSSLERSLQEAVTIERLTREGVNPEAVRRARIDVDVVSTKIGGPKGATQSGEGSFILAYIMWFVLYIAIILYGASVMGSVVEEKTSRVIEVLISSLRPFQLLAGKVIGVGAVGVFQLSIWGAFAMVLGGQQVRIIQMFNASPDLASRALIPQITAATAVIFMLYFLLGYFLYAAMFAAVAAMSSSEAEARQAQTPIVMLLVVPSVMMIGILNDPNGSLAKALGLIPFFSPIAMPVRWAAAPIPLPEVIVSLAVLAVALVAITWLAARIYRVGILMYGKRPTIPEVLRWIRAS